MEKKKGQIEAWKEEIVTSAILQDVVPLSSPYDHVDGFEGVTIVEGQQIKLQVLLPSSFPLKLPYILLVQQTLGVLPHVAPNGQICFQESEGIILDRRQPAGIIKWAIGQAIDVISKGLKGENLKDFTDEFEVYWEYLKGKVIYNLYNPSSQSEEVSLFHNTETQLKIIAASADDLSSFFRSSKDWKKTIIQKVSYLVLPSGTLLTPPKPGQNFWSINELRNLVQPALELMPPKQKRKLFYHKKSKHGIILIALPRSSKGYALFGVEFYSEDGVHPFVKTSNKIKLKPVSVKHCEASYLVPRGGGNKDLTSKKVLLVGCGSVGGHIAHEIVRAGVLNLSLVDYDKLTLENTYRHVLGVSKLDKPKASALKDELQNKYPFLKASAFDSSLEETINQGNLKLGDFDLIIVAIGTPTVELWLNEEIHRLKNSPPTIFTWLEPLGIGGHALLVQPNKKGCLECLYSSKDEEFYLANRASFAAPRQQFSTSLTGCNNLYTPYGSLDASSTACLAVKVALDSLLGKENQSALYSWKGDSESFISQGFHLSHRYNLSQELLNEYRHAFAVDSCLICGK